MYRPGPSSNGSNGGASAGPILDLSHHLRDGRNWLVLVGELDFGSAPQLVAALNAAQRDGRPIVVDLRGLRFIDSSGLRALLHASRAGLRTGLPLQLIAGSPTVMRVFDLTGTAVHFEWAEVPADAVMGYGGRS